MFKIHRMGVQTMIWDKNPYNSNLWLHSQNTLLNLPKNSRPVRFMSQLNWIFEPSSFDVIWPPVAHTMQSPHVFRCLASGWSRDCCGYRTGQNGAQEPVFLDKVYIAAHQTNRGPRDWSEANFGPDEPLRWIPCASVAPEPPYKASSILMSKATFLEVETIRTSFSETFSNDIWTILS